MENDFDATQAEINEQNILLDKGLVFTSNGKEYHIAQPRWGQLDKIAAEQIKLDINTADLESEDWTKRFNEQKRVVHPNAKICAKILAIATVSHHRPNIDLYFWYAIKERYLVNRYTKRFMWELTPSDILKLTTIVLKASNYADFTSSIALLSLNRTTAPQAIEDGLLD